MPIADTIELMIDWLKRCVLAVAASGIASHISCTEINEISVIKMKHYRDFCCDNLL